MRTEQCLTCDEPFAPVPRHPMVESAWCEPCRRILTTVDQLYALDPPVVWDDEWEYRVLTPACRAEDVDEGVVVGLRSLWPVGRSERAADV